MSTKPMPHINIEIKAQCREQGRIREILKSLNARFVGTDHQVDTYFNADTGRLKLREGNIENSLIYYQRSDCVEPKQSNIILFKIQPNSPLKEILINAIGVKVIVDKRREIYFIDNVKFHIDSVENLGDFIEIEAIDENGNIGTDKLYQQCQYYLKMFGIQKEELASNSYSDMFQKLLHETD